MPKKIPFYLDPDAKSELEDYAKSIWLDASELVRLLARREMALTRLKHLTHLDLPRRYGKLNAKVTVHFHQDQHVYDFFDYLSDLNISKSRAMRILTLDELKYKRVQRIII